jgi:prevent-host-death family protein
MRTVGIRELKAHLSGILRDVQGGETVLVTDRGRVVAQLSSPSLKEVGMTPAQLGLARLESTGAMRIAESPPPPYIASPVRSPAGTARDLLDEGREES